MRAPCRTLDAIAAATLPVAIDGRARLLARARRPFVVGGFLLCGLAALLPPTTNGTDRIALSFILAVGVGLIGLVDILPVDIALPGQEG